MNSKSKTMNHLLKLIKLRIWTPRFCFMGTQRRAKVTACTALLISDANAAEFGDKIMTIKLILIKTKCFQTDNLEIRLMVMTDIQLMTGIFSVPWTRTEIRIVLHHQWVDEADSDSRVVVGLAIVVPVRTFSFLLALDFKNKTTRNKIYRNTVSFPAKCISFFSLFWKCEKQIRIFESMWVSLSWRLMMMELSTYWKITEIMI